MKRMGDKMMKKAWIALFCCLTLIAGPVKAGDTPDASNYVEVGVHGSDVAKDHNRVTEYNQARTAVEGTLKLRMMDQKDDLKYRLDLSVFSNNDMNLDLVIHKGDWFTSTTSYNKFMHKLDHDQMQNLQWRESVNPEVNQPGGKMMTFVDRSPGMEYFKVYENIRQVFNFRFNTENPTDLELGFRAQNRSGYHQTMQLSHCDTCHVQSKAAKLDQTNYDAWAKVHTKVDNRFDVSYKFTYSSFENNEDPTLYYIDQPRHPVNGGNVEEFGSRQVFGGEILESGTISDNERTLHEVRVEGSVTDADHLVGNASYAKQTNKGMDLDLSTTAASFRWRHKVSKRFKLDAYLSYYTMDNDDVYVVLPAWREGRGGGGQDMDYTRFSTYNRNVSMLKLQGYYKMDQQNRITFSYRYKQVDREYQVVTFEDRETETIENRFNVRWDRRVDDLKTTLEATYEVTDNPFANATGIIETPINNISPIEGNSFVYYWQRERVGEATNLPSDDLNIRGTVSYRFNDRISMSANAGLRDASNDDLNSYSFDMSAMNAGLNLFAVLNDKVMLNFGFDHSNMKTQAYFSVPVMDG